MEKEVIMKATKLLIPMACSLAFGLAACGGDSAAEADPNNNPFAQSSQSTVPLSQGGDILVSSSSVVPPPSGKVSLGTSANLTTPATMYDSWKGYHYVTLDAEALYYTTPAAGYHYVFSAEFLPAARVIWQSAGSSAYKLKCTVDDSAVPAMKARACTVSEGIGYGMLITAFQDDAVAFNSLWNYSRAMRAYNGNQPLTPWITFTFHYDEVDLGSATDADLDIATSLIIMYLKTNIEGYLADARVIMAGIWDKEVKANMLLSGDTPMWNGTGGKTIVYNLSYFSPVALKLFAQYDNNPAHDWTSVLNTMYTYMANIQAAGTGVFPDWSDATTAVNPPNDAAGNAKTGFTYYTFNKESVRIPWRIAWDYYWYQDERALAVLQKLNNFISTKAAGDPGSKALSVNYTWNTALGADDTRNTAVSSQWLSAWCATGIGTNADWLNKCTTLVNAKQLSNTASSYFPDILLMMYSQLLNGKYVRPF